MPLYQYQCPACNTVQEELTYKVSPPPPECQCGETMKLVYCKPTLQFKGNGFYVNDYKPTVKAGEDQ